MLTTKKASVFSITAFCEGNSPVNSLFLSQSASNMENMESISVFSSLCLQVSFRSFKCSHLSNMNVIQRIQQIPLGIFFHVINTLRPRQNGPNFADDIFNCIFLKENLWIPIKIPFKSVPEGPINNIPALIQIMAWCRPSNKPLSESVMLS